MQSVGDITVNNLFLLFKYVMGETKELTLPVRTLISVGDVSMSIPMILCFCLFSYAWQKGRKLVGGGGGEVKGGRSGGYGCIAPATSPCK